MAPSVGVVIPVRNGIATISAALASVCRQPEVSEIVVVDDGSTDATATVARSYQDPRVHVVQQPPRGVSAARNAGAAATSAEWLLFLDADDVLENAAIGDLLAEAASDVDVVCGVVEDRYRDGRSLLRCPVLTAGIIHPLLPGTFLLRRAAFERCRGYEETLGYSENTDLSIRLLQQHGARDRVRFVDAVVVRRAVDPTVERSARYSERILGAADHFLRVHRAVLDEAAATALYASTGGVAAARLRRWRTARRLFARALRSPGRRPSDLARLALTFAPILRDRAWGCSGR